ncbi:hypothetical protein ESP60_01950 [Anaplasma phagocytophilum]|nr:hypothetical protein ESP60_01950 [Anaplasma phagocytophilum]
MMLLLGRLITLLLLLPRPLVKILFSLLRLLRFLTLLSIKRFVPGNTRNQKPIAAARRQRIRTSRELMRRHNAVVLAPCRKDNRLVSLLRL